MKPNKSNRYLMPKMLKSFKLERILEIHPTSSYTGEKSAMGKYLRRGSMHLFLIRVCSKVLLYFSKKMNTISKFLPTWASYRVSSKLCIHITKYYRFAILADDARFQSSALRWQGYIFNKQNHLLCARLYCRYREGSRDGKDFCSRQEDKYANK